MRYDYTNGVAYPLGLSYKELPSTLVEVSNDDVQKILSRDMWDTYTVHADGTVTITKGENPNG